MLYLLLPSVADSQIPTSRWVLPTSMTVARRLVCFRRAWLVSLTFPQGDGDSEICIVVEDDDMIDSTMNGQPYKVGRFAATLRRHLYKGALTLGDMCNSFAHTRVSSQSILASPHHSCAPERKK